MTFNLDQYPKNKLEREQMKNISYASVVESLMYIQVYTRFNIAFAVGMLKRYQSNSSIDHWSATKKIMKYLQGNKDYKFMYKQTNNLEIIKYLDLGLLAALTYLNCIDLLKSISSYMFMFSERAISWRSESK